MRGPRPWRRHAAVNRRSAPPSALSHITFFPRPAPPAVTTHRVPDEITTHGVAIPLPAMNATLTRQGGGTVSAADAGQTGGETLLFSSPTISAGQPFPRVRGDWGAPPGGAGSLYVEPRTSAGAPTSDGRPLPPPL